MMQAKDAQVNTAYTSKYKNANTCIPFPFVIRFPVIIFIFIIRDLETSSLTNTYTHVPCLQKVPPRTDWNSLPSIKQKHTSPSIRG